MKYRFSLLILIFSFNISARTLILITHNNQIDLALLANRIFIDVYKVPDSFIKLQNTKTPCIQNGQSSIHLCIDEIGNTLLLKKNESIVNKLRKFNEL